MPIPRKVLSRDMPGKTVKLATRTIRAGLIHIPAGSELLVRDAGRGFVLASQDPCPCCGISIHLDGVPRTDVFLSTDPDAPALESVAFWQSRADRNDYLWTECSNCKFIVENYKAVKTGRSDTDYTKPIYKFCPKCGKRMAVRNYKGDVVL